jgi:hypothetical protein
MRLFELSAPDPTAVKLVAATSQLKAELEDSGQTKWSVDKFLKYLARNDVSIDEADLYDMVKKAPLKNLISNIKDHKVIFKSHDKDSAEDEPDKKKDIVKKMADKAKK